MDIEIVEFYEMHRVDEKRILQGSLHIYLIDLDVDLRGIMVRKRNDSWFFGLPSLFGIDPDTKKKVKFPIFSFADRKKTDEMKKLIIKKGKEYIVNKLKEEV